MTFAKLENGKLKRCPKIGRSGGRMHTNLPRFYEANPDKAAEDGWYELVEADKPEGNFFASYAIKNGKVVQKWSKIPDSEPTIDPIEKLRADVDYIAMETGVDLEV